MSGLAGFLPPEASAYSRHVDLLLASLSLLTFLLSAPVFVLIVAFAVKYHRGKTADRKHPVNRKVWLEVSWAIVPFVLTFCLYIWATQLYSGLYRPPSDSLDISVVAQQWMWKFQHPTGQREINELHVPIGRPVQLTMASEDVIHSLFIPALRIKRDVLPGRFVTIWFEADAPGVYRLACAEFCGTDHSRMIGRFVAQSPTDYSQWLEQAGSNQTLAAQGEQLFRQFGCSGCHGPAATVHAPSLAGLYGRRVPLQNGQVVVADDQYIRDSILMPQAQIAAGYPPIMPTFQNVLSEDQVLKLVAYIKSLATEEEK
jgi:cytochrome c oxidase subunit 2